MDKQLISGPVDNPQSIELIMERISYATPLSPIAVFKMMDRRKKTKNLSCYFGNTVYSVSMMLKSIARNDGVFIGMFNRYDDISEVKAKLELGVLI